MPSPPEQLMTPPLELKTIHTEVPANGSVNDPTDSGVKDTEALDVVVQNYSSFKLNAAQLEALQKWVVEAKKEVDRQNKEARKRIN